VEQISWCKVVHVPRSLTSGDAYRLTSFGQPKEETHVRPGHNWPLKFGKVAGSMSYVEKEFKLAPRKYEKYKVSRFYNGD